MSGLVVINSRYSLRSISGVERYAMELTKELPANFMPVSPRPGSGRAASQIWEQFGLSTIVGPKDLLWSPANTGPLTVKNQVVSIHDLSPLEYPEWFIPAFSWWYRILIPRLVRRVQHIITDSNFTKQRLEIVLGVPEEQISVVPCGVNQRFFRPASPAEIQHVAKMHGLPGRYFLALGPTEPRKNIALLLAAWRRSKLYQQGWRLVLVGGKQPAIRHEARHPDGTPGVRRLGYVDESGLRALYSGATALIYPSLYEGFGLPLLEAMACGAPVAAADSGALPEVLGDAGLAFSPTDSRALANILERLASDEALRQQLRQRGLARAALFSWTDARAQIFSILRRELALV